MALQYKFFIIPIRDIEKAESEVNRFLRTVRVVNTQREFVSNGSNSFWQLSVEYHTHESARTDIAGSETRKGRADYRKILYRRRKQLEIIDLFGKMNPAPGYDYIKGRRR